MVSLLTSVLLLALSWIATPMTCAKSHKNATNTGSDALSDTACCSKLGMANFTSNLPVIIFVADSVPISGVPNPHTTRVPLTVCTCNTSDPTSAGSTSHMAQINERGSHSEDTNTIRSYEITLNNSHPYLGMPSGKKWVHYGPQNDTLGLHYWYAMEMYRGTGDTWVPKSRFAEIFYLDSANKSIQYPDDYLGLYVVLEHIEREKNRLNLTKASSADLTGGYILDNEHNKTRPGQNETQFTLPRFGIDYILREPNKAALTQPMIDYIKGYTQNFEDVLFSPDFADPSKGWRMYANESSMIDYMLAEELSKNNNDGYRGSQFLWKDAGGPLNFGPAWGLDDGFGTCCGFPVGPYNSLDNPAIQPQGWMFQGCSTPENKCADGTTLSIAEWYKRAWEDPAFRAAVARRVNELRAGPWSDAAAAATLDTAVAEIHDAGLRTLKKWGPIDACPRQVCQEWTSPQDEMNAAVEFIKNWTLARLSWFDDAAVKAVGTPSATSTIQASSAGR